MAVAVEVVAEATKAVAVEAAECAWPLPVAVARNFARLLAALKFMRRPQAPALNSIRPQLAASPRFTRPVSPPAQRRLV
jgi:hypothetical protein